MAKVELKGLKLTVNVDLHIGEYRKTSCDRDGDTELYNGCIELKDFDITAGATFDVDETEGEIDIKEVTDLVSRSIGDEISRKVDKKLYHSRHRHEQSRHEPRHR